MVSRSKTGRSVPPGKPTSDPVQAAIDYGIDIQMLMDNIKRSPTERIRRHQIALDTMRMLQRAKRI